MRREFDPGTPEWMDVPQPASDELRVDLENLRKLNAWFGSHAIIRHFLKHWFKPGSHIRLLDLCTGSADIPRMIVQWARRRGVEVAVDAVDFQPGTVEIARELCSEYPEIRVIQANSLEFVPDVLYDAAFCSLALHHFSELDAERLAASLRESSKGRVLIADLERSRMTSFWVFLITSTVFREPMTRNDARVSVRRAFSMPELAEIVKRAGWSDFGHRRFMWGRQAIWMDGGPG